MPRPLPSPYPLFPLLFAAGLAFGVYADALAQDHLQADVGLAYTGELVANVAGGAERGVVYLDNLDVTLGLERGPLTVFFYGLANQGGQPSRLVGDAQGTSNIEAPSTWKLYEAWVQALLWGDRLSLLAGLYDFSSEFDVARTGALFLHSSHGTGPDVGLSGRNGPSAFPVTSLSVRARARLTPGWTLQAALFDGVPGSLENPSGTRVILGEDDGVFIAAETAFSFGADDDGAERPQERLWTHRLEEPPDHTLRLAAGAWRYSAPLPRVDAPRRTAQSQGLYVLAEGELWASGGAGARRLLGFARVGTASASVNRFGSYLGGGLVLVAPLPRRPSDLAGLALAHARNGDPYQRRVEAFSGAALAPAETALEVTYAAHLTDRLSLQADVQYVHHPDTRRDLAAALVLGLRLLAEL